MEKIPQAIVDQLREDIRPRGMGKWISHEILARDLFNRGFSSGLGVMESWSEQLTNGSDDELVSRWHTHIPYLISSLHFNLRLSPCHSLMPVNPTDDLRWSSSWTASGPTGMLGRWGLGHATQWRRPRHCVRCPVRFCTSRRFFRWRFLKLTTTTALGTSSCNSPRVTLTLSWNKLCVQLCRLWIWARSPFCGF